MKKVIFIVILLVMSCVVYAEPVPTLYNKEIVSNVLKTNLDKINLSEAPKMLRFVLGKPKINIEINGDVFGFKITGDKIKDFVEGGLDKPHYIIRISEDFINELINSEDPKTLVSEGYESGKIVIEPQKIGSKIKFWFAKKFISKFN